MELEMIVQRHLPKFHQEQSICWNQFKNFQFDDDINQIETEDSGEQSNDDDVKMIYPSQYNNNLQLKIVNLDKNLLNIDQQINISHEFFISSDGALRLLMQLNWISFGYQQQSAIKVEEKKSLGVINIQYEKLNYWNIHSYNVILEQIKKFPQIKQETILFCVNIYQQINTLINTLIKSVDKDIMNQKDQELILFTQICHKFLSNYNQTSQNKLFSYSIGRVNLVMKDFQTVETGYSKEYLDLLGINQETLSQNVLRKQKIDLQQNINDITQQSLKGIEQMQNCTHQMDCDIFESQIVTFDGFPIKLYQKKIKVCDLYQPYRQYGIDFEYVLMIIEIDVDLQDLENLISYRQRIYNNQENLSLEDFLRKELSFQFEDVEYSVRSQSFIDKFYTKNIDELKELQKKNEEAKKQCKYRLINKDHIPKLN